MENGFDFELYEMIFTNCFINSSRYANGNLRISLFGVDPETNETAHFVDITVDAKYKKTRENEIIVDFRNKPTLIPQLINLGILKEQVGICAINSVIYPIYTIDTSKIQENQYCMQLIAA